MTIDHSSTGCAARASVRLLLSGRAINRKDSMMSRRTMFFVSLAVSGCIVGDEPVDELLAGGDRKADDGYIGPESIPVCKGSQQSKAQLLGHILPGDDRAPLVDLVAHTFQRACHTHSGCGDWRSGSFLYSIKEYWTNHPETTRLRSLRVGSEVLVDNTSAYVHLIWDSETPSGTIGGVPWWSEPIRTGTYGLVDPVASLNFSGGVGWMRNQYGSLSSFHLYVGDGGPTNVAGPLNWAIPAVSGKLTDDGCADFRGLHATTPDNAGWHQEYAMVLKST